MMKPVPTCQRQRGFTLVELIMVIVIMGVIGGMVSVFMKSPIDAYFASGRRAALTDVADTVVRRMARDIQRALPNSIRTSGSNCLEFIPTKTGGRYRTADNLAGDSLNFAAADTTFNMLGSNSALPAAQRIASGDLIVVYNLGPGINDAYAGDNVTAVSAAPSEPPAYTPAETVIPISGFKFPLESGTSRFHVVESTERLVSYSCIGSKLYRNVNASSFVSRCADTSAIFADNVDCGSTKTWFNYSGSDLHRNALVSMTMTVQDSSGTESVTLQHEVHVSNTP